MDEIKDLFGLAFFVSGRKLTVGEYTHDYIGEYQDILQISIGIDYRENTSKAETAPLAEEIKVRLAKN